MTRRLITGALGAAAALVLVPASAQARTACPAETVAPSNANSAQVSDAIFCIVNQLRAGYGLPALRRDVRLDAAATRHSQDMAARDYFSHTSPEGLTPGDRALAQGYTIGVSENIASGQGSARAVTTGWMASDGHCRNIFSAARDIGVGTSSSAIYTQVFGDYFSAPVDPAAGNGCPYTLDLTARPALSALNVSPRRFRAGNRARVSFTVSEVAKVTLRIERATGGGYVRLTGRIDRSARQGTNRFRFSGRLRGKRLEPGRYRVRAVATTTSGASPMKRARFTIRRP